MTHGSIPSGLNAASLASLFLYIQENLPLSGKTKDKYNERWLELKQEPDRYRSADKFPPFETIMAEQHHVFRNTLEQNSSMLTLDGLEMTLTGLEKLFDEMPNVYTELGAVLAELGRQPKSARAFMIKYQDRVLFGKDTYKKEEYYTYFRVLETGDEYFPYYPQAPRPIGKCTDWSCRIPF